MMFGARRILTSMIAAVALTATAALGQQEPVDTTVYEDPLEGRWKKNTDGTKINGGVFTVRRGHDDQEAFKTATLILERGGTVLMYAEGGRSRTGDLGEPKRGVGKMALESGAPVVPVAIHGSAHARAWKRLRCAASRCSSSCASSQLRDRPSTWPSSSCASSRSRPSCRAPASAAIAPSMA